MNNNSLKLTFDENDFQVISFMSEPGQIDIEFNFNIDNIKLIQVNPNEYKIKTNKLLRTINNKIQDEFEYRRGFDDETYTYVDCNEEDVNELLNKSYERTEHLPDERTLTVKVTVMEYFDELDEAKLKIEKKYRDFTN